MVWVKATSVVLGLLVAPCAAWVSLSQSRYGTTLAMVRAQQHGLYTGPKQAALGFLWTLPDNTNDTRGLGKGITWAWDPNLCPTILGLFREDLFFAPLVQCTDLKAAMHRAFSSWAANNRFISFVDVTAECDTLHGGVYSNCSIAELWVTSRNPLNGTGLEAATATPAIARGDGNPPFRYTNGLTSTIEVIETIGGIIEFGGRRQNGPDLCWYLDSTFCFYFHRLKVHYTPANVQLTGLTIVLFLTMTSLVFTIVQVWRFVSHFLDDDETTTWKTAIDELAKWSICGMAIRFVLIVTPWLFYAKIFLPCFNCFDFEAAATHEVGHLLGLGHPDRASTERDTRCGSQCGPGGNNSQFEGGDSQPVANFQDCRFTFDDVRVDPRLPVRNSMMKSLTQHNPTVCLQADDLQGLNALYPDCENPITTPVCFPISHNIGYVRFAVYTLIPIIIALLVAVCIGTFTQRESLANAKHRAAVRVKELNEARKEAHEARKLHKQQSSMVRIHAKREQSAHRRENEQRDLNEKERKEMPRRVRRLISDALGTDSAKQRLQHGESPENILGSAGRIMSRMFSGSVRWSGRDSARHSARRDEEAAHAHNTGNQSALSRAKLSNERRKARGGGWQSSDSLTTDDDRRGGPRSDRL